MTISLRRFIRRPLWRRNQRSAKMPDNQKIEARKNKLYVFKIGGSAFDLIREEKDRPYLIRVFEELVAAHKDGYKMVLTCGAGPWGDASKDFASYFKDFGFVERSERGDVQRSCSFTADVISCMINKRNKTDSIRFCEVQNPEYIAKIVSRPESLHTQIPVLVVAPQTAQIDYTINSPGFASDAHSIIIADWIAARYTPGVELIFIKNTKGVYPKDPNRTDVDSEKNQRIKEIYIDDFLNPSVIDRTGTDGRGDHLLETVAGQLFQDVEHVKHLELIRIITAKEPRRINCTLEGENRGSIIYNKNSPLYQAYMNNLGKKNGGNTKNGNGTAK